MSITIKQTPADFSSANHELWHVVESTAKATAGFRYVFDIYKGSTLLTRVKNTPQGTGQYGVLDVHNIVRSELDISLQSFDPFNFGDTFTGGADVFFVDYDIRYGEVSGGVLTANVSSGAYRAYNNYLRKPYEGVSTALTSGVYFLTNRPFRSKAYEGQPVIMTVRLNNGIAYKRRINGSGGTPITSIDITGSNQAVTFGFEPVNGQFFELFNNTVLDTVGAYYFENACSKYQPYTLVFLNAFGGWDSFTFVHGRLMNDNEKKKFEQFKWQLGGFTMSEKTGNVYNEGWKAYANTISPKMKLTSDILNTDEYMWLAELINSPCVYIYLQSEFHPVQVTNTNYEFKNSLQNKTETLEVEIQFLTNNTQYR